MSLNRTLLAMALIGSGTASLRSEPPLPSASPTSEFRLRTLPNHCRTLAQGLAEQLAQPEFQALLQSRLKEDGASLMLHELVELHQGRNGRGTLPPLEQVQALNDQIIKAKGLSGFTEALLEVRLVSKAGLPDWSRMLVASVPAGSDRTWKSIEAFDGQGQVHQLDPRRIPVRPVLVVGINGREDLRAGVAMLNRGLADAGLQIQGPTLGATATTVSGTKLTWAFLRDDKEPWVKGDAEVFAITSGVNPVEDKPSIQIVDMPWLNVDRKNYYPNQPILFWNNYRFNAANIQLFEHDDSTNYQQILSAILKAAGTALVASGTGASYGWIPILADAILNAMPSVWFEDEDDYVDSFYLIEKGRSYGNLTGAAGNASIGLMPFTLTSN